jgi:hypothetical protein
LTKLPCPQYSRTADDDDDAERRVRSHWRSTRSSEHVTAMPGCPALQLTLPGTITQAHDTHYTTHMTRHTTHGMAIDVVRCDVWWGLEGGATHWLMVERWASDTVARGASGRHGDKDDDRPAGAVLRSEASEDVEEWCGRAATEGGRCHRHRSPASSPLSSRSGDDDVGVKWRAVTGVRCAMPAVPPPAASSSQVHLRSFHAHGQLPHGVQ